MDSTTNNIPINGKTLVFGDNSSVKCDNNCGSISIGKDSKVHCSSNCGRIIVADRCTVYGEKNAGTIVTGNQCILTNLDVNCGTITVGRDCTIQSANNNYGMIICGVNCRIQSQRNNCGKIIKTEGQLLSGPSQKKASQSGKLKTEETRPQSDTPGECSICFERQRDLAFNCGHTCCATCGSKLETCPICRVLISQKIRLYYN